MFSAFMSSLQLDSSSPIIPEPQKLPQALVEKCAAISVRPNAIKDLIDAMQCKHHCDASLLYVMFKIVCYSYLRLFSEIIGG